MSFASLPSCMLSGVLVLVISVALRATLSISVMLPTFSTTASPWPFMTIVERSMMFGG